MIGAMTAPRLILVRADPIAVHRIILATVPDTVYEQPRLELSAYSGIPRLKPKLA